MKTFLKITFSVLFLAITAIWLVFALDLFKVIDVHLSFLDGIYNHSIEEGSMWNKIGIYLVVGFGALFMIYCVIMFPINKIPIIGSIINWVTSFVAVLSVLGVVAGICLVFLM